jgi:hypothetical protein
MFSRPLSAPVGFIAAGLRPHSLDCAVIGIVVFWLAGCDGIQGPSDRLASCLASTEQTILLRQLSLTGKAKETFESCLKMTTNENFCRGLYLNANGAVRQCMKEAGYIFLDMDFYLSHDENPYEVGDVIRGGKLKEGVCNWEKYQDPSCYHPSWWFKITHWWAFKEDPKAANAR